MEYKINEQKIIERYVTFKTKASTEIEKAKEVALQTAKSLNWDEEQTQGLVDYITGEAEDSLRQERVFWDGLIEEVEEETQNIEGTPASEQPEPQTVKILPFSEEAEAEDL